MGENAKKRVKSFVSTVYGGAVGEDLIDDRSFYDLWTTHNLSEKN